MFSTGSHFIHQYLCYSMCKSKVHGGLGILNMEKFAAALRIRWLWGAWTDPSKPWVTLGNLCDDKDKDIFAVATKPLFESLLG